MMEKIVKMKEWIAKDTICRIFGHGDKYKFTITKSDGKTYEYTNCNRCWTEIEKEVK